MESFSNMKNTDLQFVTESYKNDGKQRIYVVCHRLCFILFILIPESVNYIEKNKKYA